VDDAMDLGFADRFAGRRCDFAQRNGEQPHEQLQFRRALAERLADFRLQYADYIDKIKVMSHRFVPPGMEHAPNRFRVGAMITRP